MTHKLPIQNPAQASSKAILNSPKAEMQKNALNNAIAGESVANYQAILELTKIGFAMDEQGYYTTRLVHGPKLQDANAAKLYLSHRTACLPHEVFGMIWLDCHLRVLAVDELFRGSINSTAVHTREVVRVALQHNAAVGIAWHNHPSGPPEPSQPDILLTERLQAALDLIDVTLADHFVVSNEGIVSFLERNLL